MNGSGASGNGLGSPGVAELAVELRTAVNRLTHSLRRPAAVQGLTPTRLAALRTLERHGSLRPGDLATRMAITPASISRLTEVLEQGGWLTREPDPADRRACLLSLSDHGRTTLEGQRRESATELAADISILTDDERAALRAALPLLTALADRQTDQAHDAGSTERERATVTPAVTRQPRSHRTSRAGPGA